MQYLHILSLRFTNMSKHNYPENHIYSSRITCRNVLAQQRKSQLPVCSYCLPGVSDRVCSCPTLNQLEKVKGLGNQGYVIIVYVMQAMKCWDNGDQIIKCPLIISGVGTIAAVVALVAALFWLEINIHNPLLRITDSFRGPNCMQAMFPLLHQSDMKLHYKVIKVLAVRWLGTRLMHIFKETITSDESSWERRQSQYI